MSLLPKLEQMCGMASKAKGDGTIAEEVAARDLGYTKRLLEERGARGFDATDKHVCEGCLKPAPPSSGGGWIRP